ncbi:MAG: hypothetical protein HY904_19880 [Deltaproteobacteria bacterium]|nr:hypothetical protein [Deltaproteobacteria bacterium]
MKAFFKDMDAASIVRALEAAMVGRRLGEITRITLENGRIRATLSKLGTSTLTFTAQARPDGTEVHLVEEKLALTHRPLRNEVKDKFVRLVEKAGGVVTGPL